VWGLFWARLCLARIIPVQPRYVICGSAVAAVLGSVSLYMDWLIFWYMMFLFTSDLKFSGIAITRISKQYAGRIKYVINIWEKKKENALACCGCRSNILK
jgi:hypothetical protein